MILSTKMKFSAWILAIALLVFPMMDKSYASTTLYGGLNDKTTSLFADARLGQADLAANPASSDGHWPVTTTDGATIHRDPSKLPEAARLLRQKLIDAAATGDIETLRPIFASQKKQPQLGFDGPATDPVKFLRETSNDGAGRETLAILEELLQAPYAAYNEGTENEIYVWPYFVARDLDRLNPDELVELYKIVSHQDLQSMRDFGGWFYYRVSISAKGDWRAFVSGD